MGLKAVLLVALVSLSACGDGARLPVLAGTGLQPTLPPPRTMLIPAVNSAPAPGWRTAVLPLAAVVTRVAAFASGLDHPRWLHALPNGSVLVAATTAAPKPGDAKDMQGWVMGLVTSRAAVGVPNANRITFLRDTHGDGVANPRSMLLDGLHSPFGMALAGNVLVVANTDVVGEFRYTTGAKRIPVPGIKAIDLPAGLINRRWTKNLIASPDGKTLYVTVGSNSKVAKRDELGSDMVPDCLTSVRDDGFYGWPCCDCGQPVAVRVQPPRPDLVAKAIAPDYAPGPHTAPLGLASPAGTTLPAQFASAMPVGQHGSWSRRPHSGYQVIFVPFAAGQSSGLPVDMLPGFLSGEGTAYGRPVRAALDKRGDLLVADDVGNLVWRVSVATPTAPRADGSTS